MYSSTAVSKRLGCEYILRMITSIFRFIRNPGGSWVSIHGDDL